MSCAPMYSEVTGPHVVHHLDLPRVADDLDLPRVAPLDQKGHSSLTSPFSSFSSSSPQPKRWSAYIRWLRKSHNKFLYHRHPNPTSLLQIIVRLRRNYSSSCSSSLSSSSSFLWPLFVASHLRFKPCLQAVAN